MRRRYGSRLRGAATTVFFGPRPKRVFPRVFPIVSAPTPQAEQRMLVVRWLGAHEGYVRKTARHFGYSPSTVARWAARFYAGGVQALVDRSRRPRKVRRPTTPSAIVIRIRELREQYPRWGREKLRVLLAREDIRISAKTIDRTLARLRARGELREPRVVKRAAQLRLRALSRIRRPSDLVVDRPGFLQIDTQELWRGGPFTFAAIDHLTRKRVLFAAKRNTAAAGAQFLERVAQVLPFPIWAVQTDGGSEYMAEFAQTAATPSSRAMPPAIPAAIPRW